MYIYLKRSNTVVTCGLGQLVSEVNTAFRTLSEGVVLKKDTFEVTAVRMSYWKTKNVLSPECFDRMETKARKMKTPDKMAR